jgi:hypothetical protein
MKRESQPKSSSHGWSGEATLINPYFPDKSVILYSSFDSKDVAGSVRPNTSVTILKGWFHEGRVYFRVHAPGVTGWVSEAYIKEC